MTQLDLVAFKQNLYDRGHGFLSYTLQLSTSRQDINGVKMVWDKLFINVFTVDSAFKYICNQTRNQYVV